MVVYIQDTSVVRKCTACWLSTGGGKACTQMSCSSAKSCPECAVVTGRGRPAKPLLSPIPVQSSFQIFGVDLIELPVTSQGNISTSLCFRISSQSDQWCIQYLIKSQNAL